MRKFMFALLSLVVFLGLAAAPSRAQDRFEIFGGYSFVRDHPALPAATLCPGPACTTGFFRTTANLNGWEASAGYKIAPWLSGVADFGQSSGTTHSASTRLTTFLFGPQLRFTGPVSPFAHVLLGVAHQSNGGAFDASAGRLILPDGENAFATAVGAGIDLRVMPFLSVRPIQIDYLVTRFHGTQNQARVSAGIVLHF